MSLRTGTELITLTLLINKVSGLYGLLALLTGYSLSPLQLSMYAYSLLALAATALLAPHIKRQSPMHCLALAWLYALDSVVNAAYTAAFAMTWFVLLARQTAPDVHGAHPSPSHLPGGSTIDDTAGFTSPTHDNVSAVDVAADGGLTAQPGSSSSGNGGALHNALFQSGSIASITVISTLWALRIYFVLIVASYARGVLRQHIVATSLAPGAPPYSFQTGDAGDRDAEDPFARGKPAGAGWRGRLGRALVRVGRGYWLGGDEEGEWARSLGGRFEQGGEAPLSVPPVGPHERERRRRAGTGPPKLTTQKPLQGEVGDVKP